MLRIDITRSATAAVALLARARFGGVALAVAARLSLAAPPTPEDGSLILATRNLGLAQLEEARNADARRSFERLGELVPAEPLPFANAAIAALRAGDPSGAERLLEKALRAGGERGDLVAIRAALEEARGRPDEARTALARAAALDPRDLESRWRLVRAIEAIPSPSARLRQDRTEALSQIVQASPANLPARLKLLVIELENGEAGPARKDVSELERTLSDADARVRGYLAETVALLQAGDLKKASVKARVLENVLRVTPRYQQSLGELLTNVVGIPLTSFSSALEAALRPREGAAIPVSLRASPRPVENPLRALRRVDLKNSGAPEEYTVPVPFQDVLFADLDLDGDLDVYLLAGGRPDRLMRNNLDGTWVDVTTGTGEPEVQLRRAVSGDFDRDGDPDIAGVRADDALVLRSNLRQGRFRTASLGLERAVDLAAEDLDADGTLDLVVATRDRIVTLRGRGDGTFAPDGPTLAASEPRAVLLADLDNDGSPDLVVATRDGVDVFRRARDVFAPWPILSGETGAADRLVALDGDRDGDLDLLLSRGGKAWQLVNEGGNANAWLEVVVEGLTVGSGKVNRGGVGSLVEVKAGDLYVARTVGVLPAHVGLGSRRKADVVRVVFPNGVPQNLFDQRARATIREVQKLKGSCPFVYAFDGRGGAPEVGTGGWTFVSDALGNAPIGLLYDGVHLARAVPREWLFVDGDALRPTPDGRLVLDYTEELWEVTFLDEAALMAVDHPEGTGIVPNERMVPEALPKRLFTVARPRRLRASYAERGGVREDVSARLAARDDVYVDPGPETRYQGIRDEHALVLDLGPLAEGDAVVLFLHGWILYTDVSINVSISQRSDLRPFPPLLEVPDGRGGWKLAMPSFGFPAGKSKRMPVDLTGVVDPRDPRVRIRTSLAIFWDEAFVTVNDPGVPIVVTELPVARATLRERGFSRGYRAVPDGPEVFDHDDVSTVPRWEDVPGLVTRLGDVTPLLRRTDDRWVAFKGGDAIRLEYDSRRLPPLPKGWRRDYVLVSDGWDKDFDKNTVTGQSVGPYPFHAMPSYPYPETVRHPDPAFLEEWLTRPSSPRAFQEAVRRGVLTYGDGR